MPVAAIQPLSTGDIRLIPVTVDHAADYLRLANDPRINGRLNNPLPFGMEQFDAMLERLTFNSFHFAWMIEYQGVICGCVNEAANRDGKLFQGGYWLDPDYQGKGIASAAIALVRDFLFTQCKALRIQAFVEPDNAPSVRVLEKCGFTREGLLRRYYPLKQRGLIDVYLYAIINE